MSKRLVVTLVASLFLGTLTTAIGIASSPAVLGITGPVLCDGGSTFVVREGATVELPENRRGAPVHFACVGEGGVEHEPRMALASLLLFALVTALYAIIVGRGVAKLEAAARPQGGSQ